MKLANALLLVVAGTSVYAVRLRKPNDGFNIPQELIVRPLKDFGPAAQGHVGKLEQDAKGSGDNLVSFGAKIAALKNGFQKNATTAANATNASVWKQDAATRITEAVKNGTKKAKDEPPVPADVAKATKDLEDAWATYTKKWEKQPMIHACASALQTARTEWAAGPCSSEFHASLEMCEKADPYCLRFDPEFDVSVKAMERGADRWCTKSECESSVEELAWVEKSLIDEWVKNPKSGYSPDELKEYMDCFVEGKDGCETGWQQNECLGKVCQTLATQSVVLSDAFISYSKLGAAYKTYARNFGIQAVIAQDIANGAGCK